jgi:nitronate monooxygenase
MTSSNRREFVRRAALVAAGLSTRGMTALDAQTPSGEIPTPRAAALMKTFGLKYPIMQSGMGIVAGPELAIAVSAAGGLGSLGMSGLNVETARPRLAQIKAATDRPFAVNFLLRTEVGLGTLQNALDAGAPIAQFSWGLPSAEFVAAIRRAGAKLGIQVGTAEGARRAVDLGADFIICQGTAAGGHVQANMPLDESLPRVLDVAKATPVLAAGGIATGAAIRRALLAGASGVFMGTRFVATREAFAHAEYKNALVKANASDAVLSVCFQDGWVNAPHGALRNQTMKMWEAEGCPPPGRRPGEGDLLAVSAIGTKRIRYSTAMPLQTDAGDRIAEMCMYAGKSAGDVTDIPGAGELMERLWKECLAAK